ncbi:MAG: hypothetical protein NDJ75_00130 [Thermoanaerobaculia bacterium]|nr:hypothetical protein [Thermoanaerobaculia bacterium]
MRPRLPHRTFLAATALLVASAARAETYALLPVRQGVRDAEVAASVERAVRRELTARGEVIDAERTRTALRRERLRSVDSATPERLRDLAAALGAGWLVAVAVHDAPRSGAPDLTLSLRIYDGDSGRLAWASSVGRSGLDGRRLLGLGTIHDLEGLAPIAVAALLEPIAGERSAVPPTGESAASGAGEFYALVPFTVVEVEEGVEVASAATESLRASLLRSGVALAEPGCVTAALRRPDGVRWGELDAESRGKLRDDCGARRLITGAVERWELAGSGLAPEPIVAVAVRLLDAVSGEILWTGSLEARGWDREGWFGHGRVYSRGAHLQRLLDRIVKRMLAADPAVKVMKESS